MTPYGIGLSFFVQIAQLLRCAGSDGFNFLFALYSSFGSAKAPPFSMPVRRLCTSRSMA